MSSSRSGIVASVIISIIVFGSVGSLLFLTNVYDPSRIAVVVLEPGFGDMSRADQVQVGLSSFGADVIVQYYFPTEPIPTVEAAEAEIRRLARTASYLLIVIVAENEDLTDVLEDIATDFPNQRFALIGDALSLDNVASAVFEIEQAAFLAGTLAGLIVNNQSMHVNQTQLSRIGIVGSDENDDIVNNIIDGFIQGLAAVNVSYNLGIELLETEWIGAINNTELAENIVYDLFMTDQVMLVFTPVRASLPGVREALLRVNETLDMGELGLMPLAMAAEHNLDYYGNPNPDIASGPTWIATSVVPRSDTAVYRIMNATLWGFFPGGETATYDLANNGVNITEFQFSTTYVYGYMINATKDFQTAILNGSIVVDY